MQAKETQIEGEARGKAAKPLWKHVGLWVVVPVLGGVSAAITDWVKALANGSLSLISELLEWLAAPQTVPNWLALMFYLFVTSLVLLALVRLWVVLRPWVGGRKQVGVEQARFAVFKDGLWSNDLEHPWPHCPFHLAPLAHTENTAKETIQIVRELRISNAQMREVYKCPDCGRIAVSSKDDQRSIKGLIMGALNRGSLATPDQVNADVEDLKNRIGDAKLWDMGV